MKKTEAKPEPKHPHVTHHTKHESKHSEPEPKHEPKAEEPTGVAAQSYSRHQQLNVEPAEDPKDARIKKLTECLVYLKDFAVHGNPNHVKAIEGALAE
jgi:hypothetical protein